MGALLDAKQMCLEALQPLWKNCPHWTKEGAGPRGPKGTSHHPGRLLRKTRLPPGSSPRRLHANNRNNNPLALGNHPALLAVPRPPTSPGAPSVELKAQPPPKHHPFPTLHWAVLKPARKTSLCPRASGATARLGQRGCVPGGISLSSCEGPHSSISCPGPGQQAREALSPYAAKLGSRGAFPEHQGTALQPHPWRHKCQPRPTPRPATGSVLCQPRSQLQKAPSSSSGSSCWLCPSKSRMVLAQSGNGVQTQVAFITAQQHTQQLLANYNAGTGTHTRCRDTEE